jgi:hypothetical protein
MKAILCALAAMAIASNSASWAVDYGAAAIEEEGVITPPTVALEGCLGSLGRRRLSKPEAI